MATLKARISGKQRAARKRNIKVAQSAAKKGGSSSRRGSSIRLTKPSKKTQRSAIKNMKKNISRLARKGKSTSFAKKNLKSYEKKYSAYPG